jgi:hypothetical protein
MNQALLMAYFVRHADTAWTLTGRHIGSTNRSLIEQVEYQAHAIGTILTARSIYRMLSSHLQRARSTAESRQAHSEEGRPSPSVHHRGLEELELHICCTGNRLSLALVTLGLYIAGSILMMYSAGPRFWGDASILPLVALMAYAVTLLLSIRLVLAIAGSGHL